eukprot:CAMPEP_0171094720 /NCGR_PEP_ID=MMETSP0766_2-20121228/42144_1 /TAXON_ID=439317 /ORGANISM="Gambierdiscus australes, Strain CAWD 149" /LENGTH=68 /DNA_ID=CAMNT_0011553417 /DNA_START=243 /DNA_END=446 /DNA_ORIENTATION=-
MPATANPMAKLLNREAMEPTFALFEMPDCGTGPELGSSWLELAAALTTQRSMVVASHLDTRGADRALS